MPLVFGADEVRLDARAGALDVAGHVHVDVPPFYFLSDGLRLERAPIGAVLSGNGKVSFCPCLGTPLAVRFRGATVAPPDDVVLHDPVLEVFGIPVAWAPAIWLRSAARFGLLPPEIAWRGADGLFLGAGIHVPWEAGDGVRGIDVRAGGYLHGGAELEMAIRTIQTMTRVKWDWLQTPAPTATSSGGGLAIDARGATAIANGDRADSVAWNVDALRGSRAVLATTDLDAAARPFDRADAQMAWRLPGWTLASGIRAVALRGGETLDFVAAGPVVVVRRAEAIGNVGAYDGTFEGGAVSGAGLGTTTFARAEGGALIATRLGPLGGSLALRGVGDVVDDGTRVGLDGAAQVRGSIALPLARAFPTSDSGAATDAWVHRTEPRLELGATAIHGSDVLAVPAARGMDGPSGSSGLAVAGWQNTLGRWTTRESIDVDAAAGAIGNANGWRPALRARVDANVVWLAMHADFARVLAGSSAAGWGGAFVARARAGLETGWNVAAHVAERDGVDPLVARVLVDAPLEPASGFLSTAGWTGGARVALPLGDRITARAGADLDIDAREIVAAIGALDFHDPCNCVVVRASVARRIGRGGVDAWLAIELPH